MLDALPPHAVHAPVIELAQACGSLLGPLRTIKCVIVEEAAPSRKNASPVAPSSDAENCVWTSDALTFLLALPLRHPVALSLIHI